MHDVRAVANAVLQLAWSQGHEVTNLALNKIVYFLHAGHLHKFGKPLVSAKIEAAIRQVQGSRPRRRVRRRRRPLGGTVEKGSAAEGGRRTRNEGGLNLQCASEPEKLRQLGGGFL